MHTISLESQLNWTGFDCVLWSPNLDQSKQTLAIIWAKHDAKYLHAVDVERREKSKTWNFASISDWLKTQREIDLSRFLSDLRWHIIQLLLKLNIS